ncbi:cytochrome P450 [Mycobacterium uberis]|uniref:cytochrome P450 n=1 Tax=Mycobacterium uberis TaxID=2162698 RepID=UPI001FB2DF49|nr:cytochrome P450 [Mycobacterium uberis]
MNGDEAFTTAVIDETLRIRSPVSFMALVAVQPFPMSGSYADADTLMIIHIMDVKRNLDTHQHPNKFRPERFFGIRSHTYAWIPFSGGLKRFWERALTCGS